MDQAFDWDRFRGWCARWNVFESTIGGHETSLNVSFIYFFAERNFVSILDWITHDVFFNVLNILSRQWMSSS